MSVQGNMFTSYIKIKDFHRCSKTESVVSEGDSEGGCAAI